jgi:hypothetical protein
MNEIVYPNRRQLEAWISDLSGSDPLLKLSLPMTDAKWYDDILGLVDLIQLPGYRKEVHCQAANLFYKVIKDHTLIDGNKRSGIVVVYLFYLVNGFILLPGAEIKKQAKRIAGSSSKNHEKWIKKMEDLFRKNTESFLEIKSDN